jgi:hypothetical protein
LLSNEGGREGEGVLNIQVRSGVLTSGQFLNRWRRLDAQDQKGM